MKKFHSRLSLKDLFEVLKLSTDVEVAKDERDWGDEQEIAYFIRKKKQKLNTEYVSFFGFDIETIKQLSRK